MKEKRPETNPSVLRTCDLGIFKVKNFLSYFFGRKFISLYVSGKLPTPGGGEGGHFRNFWVRMCRWDPGILNLNQS